jgi:hypothetical protein
MAHRLTGIRTALAADRATVITAWVPGWYGPAADEALHAWTVRQILDSGPYIDRLFDEQPTYVGHMPHQEQPARVSNAIRAFTAGGPVGGVHGVARIVG